VSILLLKWTLFEKASLLQTLLAGVLAARGIFQQLLEDAAQGIGPEGVGPIRALRKDLLFQAVEATHRCVAVTQDKAAEKLAKRMARLGEEPGQEAWLRGTALNLVPDESGRAQLLRRLVDVVGPEIGAERSALAQLVLARFVVEKGQVAALSLYREKKSERRHLKKQLGPHTRGPDDPH
jgi:hypothetical protein